MGIFLKDLGIIGRINTSGNVLEETRPFSIVIGPKLYRTDVIKLCLFYMYLGLLYAYLT